MTEEQVAEVVHICTVCKKNNKLRITLSKRVPAVFEGETQVSGDKVTTKEINTAYRCSCKTFHSLDLKNEFGITYAWH